MRWVLAVISLPAMLLLGLGESVQQHPPQASPAIDQVIHLTTPTVPPRPSSSSAQVAVPTVATAEHGTDLFAQMYDAAKSWLGTPYLWGGCTPRGVDCSCFTQHVYAAVGIHVGRTTWDQIAQEAPIPRAQLQPGDSLFFANTCTGCGPNPTHVAIYLGGSTMVDAGDPVKIEAVYWGKFMAAGRPAGL